MYKSDLEVFPLKGRTVLITRTEEGNAAERKKLEILGAKVVELPMISIEPPNDTRSIKQALGEISSFDWMVFTSANGVKAFFEMLNDYGKRKVRAEFACVGPETQRALNEVGFEASVVPEKFLTTDLAQELSRNFDISGKKVLLARAEDANKEVAKILRTAGAIVTEAPVYRIKSRNLEGMDASLAGISDVTFNSSSAVDAFLSNFDLEEILSRNIRVHCIGPVTAERAQRAGLRVDSTANVHTVNGLVDSIVQTSRQSSPDFTLVGS